MAIERTSALGPVTGRRSSSAIRSSHDGGAVTGEGDEVLVRDGGGHGTASHFHQPHAFIPRGRKLLRQAAPDVYAALLDAGASEVDVGRKVLGERRAEDDALVYLSARRPLTEWGLRRAVPTHPRVAA